MGITDLQIGSGRRMAGPSLLLAFVLFSTPISASGTDYCDIPVVDPRWSLSLLTSKKIDGTRFMGIFQLHNFAVDNGIELQGYRLGKEFVLDGAAARLQFRDLRGVWVDFLHTWGHPSVAPTPIKIPSGGKSKFSFELPQKQVANRSAAEFRLLINLEAHRACIMSTEFVALPLRLEVTGYGSHRPNSNK